MGQARQATCQQFEIKPEGNSHPLFDPNGDYIEFVIVEEPSSSTQYAPRGLAAMSQKEDILERSSSNLSDCGCLWMLT